MSGNVRKYSPEWFAARVKSACDRINSYPENIRSAFVVASATLPVPSGTKGACSSEDPLQGAVDWLHSALPELGPAEVGIRLCIGYSRARRLLSAAKAKADKA
jgi:hypothetical protein